MSYQQVCGNLSRGDENELQGFSILGISPVPKEIV